MKTIGLTEEAYNRLKAWKQKRSSFSQVVLEQVAPKGTFKATLEAAKKLPELDDEEFDQLENAIEQTRQPIKQPWK